MISSVMLNFQLTRLTANAIMEAKKRIRNTDGTVMSTEFQNSWAKPPCVQAWVKLSKLKAPPVLK